MNVRELIEKLEKMDPELPVYVKDKEAGCCTDAEYEEAESAEKSVESKREWVEGKGFEYTAFDVCRISVY